MPIRGKAVVNKVCLIEGCDRKAHGKGWCRKHWARGLLANYGAIADRMQ